MKINTEYRIYYCEYGSQDYGIWTFTGVVGDLLFFKQSTGCFMQVPKRSNSVAPKYPWLVEEVGD